MSINIYIKKKLVCEALGSIPIIEKRKTIFLYKRELSQAKGTILNYGAYTELQLIYKAYNYLHVAWRIQFINL